MIGHACGSLTVASFVRGVGAWLKDPRRGVAHGQMRSMFAQSIGVAEGSVWLFGTGRAALHALVSTLGLSAEDEVLLPGYTCVVVPNVFRHLGLTVRYVDVERELFNPSPGAVAGAIGPHTRIVVLPHNFGFVMRGIDELRQRFPRVIFVEDAAHAWGTRHPDGRFAGTTGHASFFSFEYSKCLTTGLGGALVINDPELRKRFASVQPDARPSGQARLAKILLTLIWHLLAATMPTWAARGMRVILRAPTRALGLAAQTSELELQGETMPDYGAGLHDLLAAIGTTQIRQRERIWAQRTRQAQAYVDLLSGSTRVIVPRPEPGEILLRFPVVLREPGDRERVIESAAALDIELGVWFNDVVHPRGSARYGYRDGDCPEGEALARSIINLPLGVRAELIEQQRAGLRSCLGT